MQQEPSSPAKPPGRKRGDSNSETGLMGMAANSKQAIKYQVVNSGGEHSSR